MRLDWLVPVVSIQVAKGGFARQPALLYLLILTFHHFRPQVVRVVLRDAGHHVEGQQSGGAGPELIFHEDELHPTGVLQLLKPNRVPDISAGAIELVRQDALDVLLLGVPPDPIVHLVEGHSLRSALGGFSDGELADDLPSFTLGLVPRGPQLRVDGITLALFP